MLNFQVANVWLISFTLFMNYWWVSANKDKGWEWEQYFTSDEGLDWGGSDWIKSFASKKLIAQIKKGDVIVAYQVGIGIVGLPKCSRGGYSEKANTETDKFDLDRRKKILLKCPIPLKQIKKLKNAKKRFGHVRMPRRTVSDIEPDGVK